MPHVTNKTEKQLNIKQIPFRIHQNDKVLFIKLLSDQGLTFQTFANYCMQAFLNADPAIMKVIKDWKAIGEVPKEHMDRYTLSHRERDMIQKELEGMDTEQDVDPRSEEQGGKLPEKAAS